MAKQTEGDQIDEDYRLVFTGEAGERVLRHLMLSNSIWTRTFQTGDDSHTVAFNEGQRAAVLGIIERIRRKWTPTEFTDELTQAGVDYAGSRPSVDPSAK